LIPPQSRDELAKLYVSFDALVLPSRTDYFWKEQYGRVLVEAMACGTPVVGSQSGAIPIVIGNPLRCFIEADVAQMADTIELAITQFQGGNTKDMRNALQKRAQLGNIDGFVNAFVELHLELRAHQP
jgi:glycosyltransferase involved in cell wall biosynthesis